MSCWKTGVNDDLKVIPKYGSGLPQIPADLINLKPKAYEPHAISLGPLHFGDSHFEDYVKKKEKLLRDRFSYEDSHLNKLVASITSQDDLSSIRQWYHISDTETFQEPEQFGRMMALDGIFLLEFLREISPSDSEGSTSSFRPPATQQQVLEDILKLQNQIPLFALQMTYNAWSQEKLQIPEAGLGTNPDLNTILKEAWQKLSPFDVREEPRIFPDKNAHILGFVYQNILGEGTDRTQYNGGGNKKQSLPETAFALEKKGVKFQADVGPLHEIRFARNTGTLHLPKIEINERTDAVMRNLVAFELIGCKGQAKPMKRYVELMDQLINTAEDVRVLRIFGIVNHNLGSDQEVANIWNKMREGHDENGEYGPIDSAINEVINFYGSYRIWLSEGVKTYCSTPCLIVSFIAGCIIVITAIVQTIFSGLQLHHH